MPQPLTKERLEILQEHVNAGDRIAYYTQLGQWGYKYGELAVGVVTMIVLLDKLLTNTSLYKLRMRA